MHIETKFLRLKPPPSLGDHIDGWRVCWLGGWDRGHIFFVVMVERKQPLRGRPRACGISAIQRSLPGMF